VPQNITFKQLFKAITNVFGDNVRLFSVVLVLPLLTGTARVVFPGLPNGCLYAINIFNIRVLWSALLGSTDKGLLYIFIAGILLLLLLGLNRVKPSKKKRARK
jgi:hypothetical protein